MKRVFYIFVGLAVLALFGGTGWFLYQKSVKKPDAVKLEGPYHTEIIKKTVATGAINPRKTIKIKSVVSGVLEKLFVQPGDLVSAGQIIAQVKLVPNVINLNNADAQVKRAQVSFNNAELEYKRQEQLYKNKIISDVDYQKALTTYQLAQQDLNAAQNNFDLVKQGSSQNIKTSSTLVIATIGGTVLDIPNKEGSFITETNTFSEGTTIASLANMSDMLFIGKVDESEIGKLKNGMKLKLTVGAIDTVSYSSILEFIAPQGVLEDGAIKFEIRAAVQLKKNSYIRAGYSANADIITAQEKNALAVHESNLEFSGDTAFVELQTKHGVFKKQRIKTGISDGINIQVLEGLKDKDSIKVLTELTPEMKKNN